MGSSDVVKRNYVIPCVLQLNSPATWAVLKERLLIPGPPGVPLSPFYPYSIPILSPFSLLFPLSGFALNCFSASSLVSAPFLSVNRMSLSLGCIHRY